MPGQRWCRGHVRERQGHAAALRSVGEGGAAERLRPQLLQLPLELHPAVLKPGLDLGERGGGTRRDEVTRAPSPVPRARRAAAAALTCTSESRILPASLRRSAAPRYCCRWKELSRVLSCSALKAVRSRRPPRPPGSSGPEHSAPPSGGGCPAPPGRPPAPGEREKRVSLIAYVRTFRPAFSVSSRGREPGGCPPARSASGQAPHSRALPGVAQGLVRPPPATAGAPGCPDGRGDRGYLQRRGPPSAPCSCRLSRPAGRWTAPCSARSSRGWSRSRSRSRAGGPRRMLGAGSPRWGS